MRHRPGAALLQWQPGLRAIQRLYLTLLVNAQHYGMLGWVEIKPDNGFQLFRKLRIATDLERLDRGLSPWACQMRRIVASLTPTAMVRVLQ